MLLEQISKQDMKKYIKEYYNYAKGLLDINKNPKVKFLHNEKNANDFLGKTGYYNPENMTIYLYITDRHPKDVVRSFAHELIHHYQNLNEKLPKEILHKTSEPDYASKDSHLRDMEKEAFEKGNMMFRDWTDKLKVKKNLQENKMKKEKIIKKKKEESPSTAAPPEADINDNGEIEGWEEARSNAIQKSMTKKRKLDEQESLEAAEPRLSQIFNNKQERLMNDYKTQREMEIARELMKRFIK